MEEKVDTIKEHDVLVTVDWAMKFVSRKYREGMVSDFIHQIGKVPVPYKFDKLLKPKYRMQENAPEAICEMINF